MRYKANLSLRAVLTITYFKACMKITKAVTVTLLAAECQALLAVVQRSVLTQFDSLIPLQKGSLIFPKTVPDCCQKLAKFSSLFLFLCSPPGPFNLSHILLIDPSLLQCAAEPQNLLCAFVQRSFLASNSCSVYLKDAEAVCQVSGRLTPHMCATIMIAIIAKAECLWQEEVIDIVTLPLWPRAVFYVSKCPVVLCFKVSESIANKETGKMTL